MIEVETKSLPPETKILGTKYVFKTKYKNGIYDKRKARLVVMGHKQIPGLHFNPAEIFSPVAAIQTGRCVLSMTATKGWYIRHSDVQSAFVQAPLHDELYINLPKGMPTTNANGNQIAYKLLTSLYGIRQAPRVWYNLVNKTLLAMQFTMSQVEPCLFTKNVNTDKAIIIVLIVDDLIETSPDETILLNFEIEFKKVFTLGSTGPIDWWNGIKVIYNQQTCTITLNQRAHIDQLLLRFNMTECIPIATPTDPSIKLIPATEEELLTTTDKTIYQSIVGGLMYIACTVNPAIQFAVNQCASYMASPGTSHLIAAKRILRYLKGNSNIVLCYSPSNTHNQILIPYSDASWGGEIHDARSITGTCILLNGAAVSWQSKRQQTTALSSTEAEYMAITETAKTLSFLTILCKDIGIIQPRPLPIYSDNQSAIQITGNPVSSLRTRHINIRHHFIKEKVIEGDIIVLFVPTASMLADILTKSLTKGPFIQIRDAIHGIATWSFPKETN